MKRSYVQNRMNSLYQFPLVSFCRAVKLVISVTFSIALFCGCGADNQNIDKIGDTKVITLPGGAKMEIVWCPATTSREWKKISGGKDYFMMGSSETESERDNDEGLHRVTLTDGFWIGKYEVTQAQWESIMGKNPSEFNASNRPVENVSWEDCQAFINKINEEGQFKVSLPTEAQWEYACRAGTTAPYSLGYMLNGDKANCEGIHPYGTTLKGRNRCETAIVGSYAPNAWGIYDMHGNVLEWCADWYDNYEGDTIDPKGPINGKFRVKRGGSWNFIAQYCRSASRTRGLPNESDWSVGLRLVCSASSIEALHISRINKDEAELRAIQMKQKENTKEAIRLYEAKDWNLAFELAQNADKSDPVLQYYLGLMYRNGYGVKKDEAEAVHWYLESAEQGYSKAQSNLGWMYAEGNGVTKNEKEAVRWFREAADKGYDQGQYNLGCMYVDGVGVEKDETEAVRLFRMAAEQGFVEAQCNLGVMYATGRGVIKNEKEAFHWISEAANQGFADAQYKLGVMYEEGRYVVKNYVEAARMYAKAEKQGNLDAQYKLGVMYEHGWGVLKNEKEAFRLYSLASERNHPEAKNSLGVMYAEGRVVDKNETIASDLFFEASLLGSASAKCNFGLAHLKGIGVEKNTKVALNWLKLSAESGYNEAEYNIGLIYAQGNGVPVDETNAIKWFTEAAKQGHEGAQNELRKRNINWE